MKNRRKTGKKCTHMSAAELKRIRLQVGFDLRSMARALELPYRTYQDYEYGRRGIPAQVAASVRDLRRRDRRFMQQLPRLIEADLDRRYPRGIASHAEED